MTAAAATLALAGCGGGNGGDRLLRVPSPSMSPTYRVGDEVSVNVDAYEKNGPKRGDVVVVYPPQGAESHTCGIPSQPADGHPCARPADAPVKELKFIKRVVALPGDILYIRDNRTYIDGRRLDEPYTNPSTPCGELCNLPKQIKVLPGHYYVLGDNRGESDDSRDWGPVPRTSIYGKVVAKVKK